MAGVKVNAVNNLRAPGAPLPHHGAQGAPPPCLAPSAYPSAAAVHRSESAEVLDKEQKKKEQYKFLLYLHSLGTQT